MRCTSPKSLKIGPKGYLRHDTIVPCGHCIACRINKREEWCTRICHESAYASSSCFITLTYREDTVPLAEREDGSFSREPCKADIQLFIKRLRSHFGTGIRFFIGSEHGPSTQRPHYHGFLWNLPPDAIDSKVIESIWGLGFVTVGEFSKQRANYAAKYYVEREEFEGMCKDFTLMSRRPGIGRLYADNNSDRLDQYSVSTISREGKKVPIPRYYKKLCVSEDLKVRRYFEYLDKQDWSDFVKRRLGYGQELDSIRRDDYKRTHRKQL